MSKKLTYADVASHNTKDDLYIIIHNKVYDITSFVNEHPYVTLSQPLECRWIETTALIFLPSIKIST